MSNYSANTIPTIILTTRWLDYCFLWTFGCIIEVIYSFVIGINERRRSQQRRVRKADNMQQISRCPNCGSPTVPGQRFCGGCGTQLSTVCPYCGTAVNPGFRFCPNCGAAVGGGMPQQPSGMPQQPGWAPPATTSQPPSSRSLLLVVLVILLLGLGGLVYWQFGDYLSGLFSSSTTTTTTTGTTPPAISNISVESKSETSALIVWKTDELASTQVEYGKTAEYELGPTTLKDDPTSGTSIGVLDHSVALTGLQAGTTYHYKVKSKDAAGNEAVSASDKTFKTAEAAP